MVGPELKVIRLRVPITRLLFVRADTLTAWTECFITLNNKDGLWNGSISPRQAIHSPVRSFAYLLSTVTMPHFKPHTPMLNSPLLNSLNSWNNKDNLPRATLWLTSSKTCQKRVCSPTSQKPPFLGPVFSARGGRLCQAGASGRSWLNRPAGGAPSFGEFHKPIPSPHVPPLASLTLSVRTASSWHSANQKLRSPRRCADLWFVSPFGSGRQKELSGRLPSIPDIPLQMLGSPRRWDNLHSAPKTLDPTHLAPSDG